jgi:hypothetical protein
MKVTFKENDQFNIVTVDEVIFGPRDVYLIKNKKTIKLVKHKELYRIEN